MVKGFNRDNGKETSQEEIKAIEDEIESIVTTAKEERRRLIEERDKTENAPVENDNVKESISINVEDTTLDNTISQPIDGEQIKVQDSIMKK